MKVSFAMILAGIVAVLFSFGAATQPRDAGPARAPGAKPMDCSKVKDKVRCEALNKDIEACKDKVGDEWRECMHRPAPPIKVAPPKPRDCSKARNKERCEAHNAALEACKDKETRAEHRKCMAAQLPAAAAKKP